ncbi:hypothetical protein AB0323_12620 [Arthrobacter sp. NPDC080031]|uniref:hypothetical protein n=1 Tax=Arthrobacter sp. NPDC080031 TaxID=3155918 RepID=UPI0034502930
MTSVATPEVPTVQSVPAEAGEISLADIAKTHNVRFLLATFVDMTGKPCAKLVPVEAADELEAGAMGFAGYAAGLIGQKPQDSDLIAVPDLTSFTPVPFIKEGLAIIHCDPHVDGAPWPFAPRVILKNTLARLAEKGMQAKVGAEVEYFLVTKNPTAPSALPTPMTTRPALAMTPAASPACTST